MVNELNPETVTPETLEEVNKSLNTIFITNAKITGFYKATNTKRRQTKVSRNHKPWFDRICPDVRKEYICTKK